MSNVIDAIQNLKLSAAPASSTQKPTSKLIPTPQKSAIKSVVEVEDSDLVSEDGTEFPAEEAPVSHVDADMVRDAFVLMCALSPEMFTLLDQKVAKFEAEPLTKARTERKVTFLVKTDLVKHVKSDVLQAMIAGFKIPNFDKKKLKKKSAAELVCHVVYSVLAKQKQSQAEFFRSNLDAARKIATAITKGGKGANKNK